MALAAAGGTLAGTPSFRVQTSPHQLPVPALGPPCFSEGAVGGGCFGFFPSVGGGKCPSCLGAAGTVGAPTRHRSLALLRQKAELLAYLPPCQLMTLPGGSPPSGQLSLEASCMSAGTSPGLLVSVVPF